MTKTVGKCSHSFCPKHKYSIYNNINREKQQILTFGRLETECLHFFLITDMNEQSTIKIVAN